MRHLILSLALCLAAPAAFAGLVRSLQQEPETGTWRMNVPGWSATLAIKDADAMTATLGLQPEGGKAMAATVDMMGQDLPTLLNIEEVLLCGDDPDIAVTVADLLPEGGNGIFVYRRFVFSASGEFRGEVTDEASATARGALPAAVVADEMAGLCGKAD